MSYYGQQQHYPPGGEMYPQQGYQMQPGPYGMPPQNYPPMYGQPPPGYDYYGQPTGYGQYYPQQQMPYGYPPGTQPTPTMDNAGTVNNTNNLNNEKNSNGPNDVKKKKAPPPPLWSNSHQDPAKLNAAVAPLVNMIRKDREKVLGRRSPGNLNDLDPRVQKLKEQRGIVDKDIQESRSRGIRDVGESIEILKRSTDRREIGDFEDTKIRAFTGIVTQFQDNFGMIDGNCFYQTSTVKGPLPRVGDRVLVEAEPVEGMPFKFNSKRVQIFGCSDGDSRRSPAPNNYRKSSEHQQYISIKPLESLLEPGFSSPSVARILDEPIPTLNSILNDPSLSFKSKRSSSPLRSNHRSRDYDKNKSDDLAYMLKQIQPDRSKYRPDSPEPVPINSNSFSFNLTSDYPAVRKPLNFDLSTDEPIRENRCRIVDFGKEFNLLRSQSPIRRRMSPEIIRRVISPEIVRRSRSPAHRRRSRSRSISPRRRSRSPDINRRIAPSRRSPPRRISHSPRHSRSPSRRGRRISPLSPRRGRRRSISPDNRRRSRTPERRRRSRSPERRPRRSRTPERRRSLDRRLGSPPREHHTHQSVRRVEVMDGPEINLSSRTIAPTIQSQSTYFTPFMEVMKRNDNSKDGSSSSLSRVVTKDTFPGSNLLNLNIQVPNPLAFPSKGDTVVNPLALVADEENESDAPIAPPISKSQTKKIKIKPIGKLIKNRDLKRMKEWEAKAAELHGQQSSQEYQQTSKKETKAKKSKKKIAKDTINKNPTTFKTDEKTNNKSGNFSGNQNQNYRKRDGDEGSDEIEVILDTRSSEKDSALTKAMEAAARRLSTIQSAVPDKIKRMAVGTLENFENEEERLIKIGDKEGLKSLRIERGRFEREVREEGLKSIREQELKLRKLGKDKELEELRAKLPPFQNRRNEELRLRHVRMDENKERQRSTRLYGKRDKSKTPSPTRLKQVRNRMIRHHIEPLSSPPPHRSSGDKSRIVTRSRRSRSRSFSRSISPEFRTRRLSPEVVRIRRSPYRRSAEEDFNPKRRHSSRRRTRSRSFERSKSRSRSFEPSRSRSPDVRYRDVLSRHEDHITSDLRTLSRSEEDRQRNDNEERAIAAAFEAVKRKEQELVRRELEIEERLMKAAERQRRVRR